MDTTPTQEKLLKAAMALMLGKGYPATSVDEICDKAGVSKGSFYHAYGSKEDLSLALLDWYHAGGSQRIFDGPFNQLPPQERMFAFVDRIKEVSREIWGSGCLLGSLGLEMANTHPKIRQRVADLFNRLEKRLAEIFAPAAQGEDGRKLAEDFLVMMEGAILLARVSGDWSVVHRGFDNFKLRLERLIHEPLIR